MKTLTFVYCIFLSLALVHANTETFQLRVSHDPSQWTHAHNWINVTEFKDINTITLPTDDTNSKASDLNAASNLQQKILFPVSFEQDKLLFVKVCWTAIDPISIKQVELYNYNDTSITAASVPHHNNKILMVVNYSSDSYPKLNHPVRINVSLSSSWIPGVPNEIYPTLLLITFVVVVASFFLNSIWEKVWLY